MKFFSYFVTLLIMSGAAAGQNPAAPSERAIKEGFKEVRTFRDVLYPLSHQGLLQKDYGTLISSGMYLKRAAWQYSKMVYKTHNHAKDSIYRACSDSLSKLAIAYAAAAERFDTNSVCTLLPQIEQQFEGTAAAIITYRWLEFDELYATVEPFYDALVTNRGMDAPKPKDGKKPTTPDLRKTVDIISNQMAAWVASPVPAEIQYRATLIGEEQAYYTKVVDNMKLSSAAQDTTKLTAQITDLKVRLRNFTRAYLQ